MTKGDVMASQSASPPTVSIFALQFPLPDDPAIEAVFVRYRPDQRYRCVGQFLETIPFGTRTSIMDAAGTAEDAPTRRMDQIFRALIVVALKCEVPTTPDAVAAGMMASRQ